MHRAVRDVRARSGFAATEDLVLLLSAVIAFSLFFASLTGAHLARQQAREGDVLQGRADALLDAVRDDPRWTIGRGVFLRSALDNVTDEDLVSLAGAGTFTISVWDAVTDERWTFGGSAGGRRRTASTSANIVAEFVHPARVVVTVWT